MRDSLKAPEAHHTVQGCRIEGRPVHRAGLLFHHPPTSAPYGTVEVVVERLEVWVALPYETCAPLFAIITAVFKEAEWVGIPTGNIEIGTNSKVIELNDATHVVMYQ